MKTMKDKIVNGPTEDGQMAGEAVVEAVENQLADNNPPETKQTLERLMNAGESRENAMRYIASALSVELHNIMKNREPYNHERYIKYLNALPTMPWENE
jgi:hypothetical protein